MRKIPRAPATKRSIVRAGFVDLLKQQMRALKALRKRVADAERLAGPPARQKLH